MHAQSTSKLLAGAFSPPDRTTPCTQASLPSRPRSMRVLSALTATSMLASLTYLHRRWTSVIAMPEPDSILWAVLLIEMATAVPRLFMQLSVLCDATKAAVVRPLAETKYIDAKLSLPRVDVFITCCGEGIDVVLDTVQAACVQQFPTSLFRVIVLDDGRSTQLKDAIFSLRTLRKYTNLYYASRNANVSTHSKAANLNFGLSFASTLPGSSADYVCVLDVDMIVSPHWLKTVLNSLLHQPSVALVCAIQRYYNVPNSDPLGMMHLLTHIDSLIYTQNAAQEAWCGGSGFIVRPTALQKIGGFPEDHLQEDLVTSLLLSAAGWKTVTVLDPLQWGLAADTMSGWIKQRQRWAAGIISMCQYACSSRAQHMPFTVRLRAALWGAVDTYSSSVWTLSMLVLPLAVMTGKPLLPTHQLRLQLHLAVLDFALQSLSHYRLSSLIDFRMSILEPLSAIWMKPLLLATACRCILPLLLGRPLPPFTPTGLPTTGDSERAARKKGTSCLKVVLWECGGWLHALCLPIYLAAIGTSIITIYNHTPSSSSSSNAAAAAAAAEEEGLRQSSFPTTTASFLNAFILRIGWPPLFLLLMALLKNAWIPIAYAVSPPPLRDRKDMLCESSADGTGARYPTERVKGEYMKRASEGFWWGMVGFYAVVVVGVEVLFD